MNEGKDENHPKDGEDTVCRVAPVEDGVDVGFIRQVGAATLDVGEVGHHVDQAEQLDVVQVETAPGPAEEIYQLQSAALEVRWRIIMLLSCATVKRHAWHQGAYNRFFLCMDH